MCTNFIYAQRTSRAWSRLSEPHFAACPDMALGFLGSGCLDAPEEIPGGSMQGFGRGPTTAFTSPRYVYRNALATEPADELRREVLATRLVAEVLTELIAEAAV
ncbi:hypothetical protein [Acidovorax sp. sic0104]|uniref:hypothetical protein n=1 Tax=Acidovorax sp. sic0104 TaxID=2854784 RepID=UPI001C4953A3|nr:hypothetical protein [Acidovorax sp. sic0104]MBV7542055.1 hypothetical protein [Acidovorax sp. sic0104]